MRPRFFAEMFLGHGGVGDREKADKRYHYGRDTPESQFAPQPSAVDDVVGEMIGHGVPGAVFLFLERMRRRRKLAFCRRITTSWRYSGITILAHWRLGEII
jgi:hypothetical protein